MLVCFYGIAHFPLKVNKHMLVVTSSSDIVPYQLSPTKPSYRLCAAMIKGWLYGKISVCGKQPDTSGYASLHVVSWCFCAIQSLLSALLCRSVSLTAQKDDLSTLLPGLSRTRDSSELFPSYPSSSSPRCLAQPSLYKWTRSPDPCSLFCTRLLSFKVNGKLELQGGVT